MKAQLIRNTILSLSLVAGSASAADPGNGKTVLIVLSAKNYVTTQEGRRHPTGFFMSELAVPGQALVNAGYTIQVATPGGVQPTMDKISDGANWFGGNQTEYAKAKAFVATTLKNSPTALESLDESALDGFAGVFVPGGHAPMEDLARDPAMGRVLRHFHAKAKPTGLICHGPTALFSATDSIGDWIYAGYRMTIFSTAEERQEEDAGHLDGHMRYYPDARAKELGGLVSVATPWTSSAIRDRELITGQNPMSDKQFAALLLEALADQPPYIRFWRGWRKDGISEAAFNKILKDKFMPATVKIYAGRGLNAYHVVIPDSRAIKTSITGDLSDIPDEIALVALDREASYKSIRSTPEGKRYADAHWKLFRQRDSKSLVPTPINRRSDEALQPEVAYDMLGKSADWRSGHTVFFMGRRKPAIATPTFLRDLGSHVRLAADMFEKRGLRGYVVIATENLELAFLNWNDKSALDAAMASDDGKRAARDASRFMDSVMMTPSVPVGP